MGVTDCVVRDGPFAGRTARAVAALGGRAAVASDEVLADALDRDGPLWLFAAGAVPRELARLPPSATGRPLLALGRALAFSGAIEPAWLDVVRATGGVVERGASLPEIASAWIERPRELARALRAEGDLPRAVVGLADAHRVVLTDGADVRRGARLRVVLFVTSLHRGGAERVVLDLHAALPRAGVDVTLAVLDRPRREAFAPPPGALLLADAAPRRSARIAALARAAAAWGADLVHAHLVDADDARALEAAGVCVVLTAHNARPGWPPGYEALAPGVATLAIGCSIGATRDLLAVGATIPTRTAWNAVRPAPSRDPAAREQVRRELGVADAALVAVMVANARPQKRIDRAVHALAELRGAGEDAHLVVVGGRAGNDDAAAAAVAAVDAAIAARGVGARVHRVGPRDDPERYLAAADVFLSTSAHEGLSLAQLEARAAGLPVVATAVGGADELISMYSACTLVPPEASPAEIARAIRAARGEAPAEHPHAFRIPTMAARHAALYARASRSTPAAARRGLVLVTNNFSTGGAQSSARRFLLELSRRGVPCEAVVIEERAERPTPGRRALAEAGIPVTVAPRAGSCDPAATAAAVVARVDALDPRAVIFWNVIPEHKILVADALLDRPVFDVSPGEMYFASLARYFARPRAGLPYLSARDYGALLAGAIVKWEGEAARAREALGAPVHVVPNGVALPDAPTPRRPGPPAIGTLARLGRDKKLEELIDAFARARPRLPDGCELLVAGDPEAGSGSYPDELRARAAGLPVRFTGFAPPDELLAQVDLFALVAEPAGCPNASLEAMAHGRAVVATDVGGVREQVVPGETGWITPRGDVGALAEALVEALADRARLARLAAAGRARAEERFSVGRMTDEYGRIVGLW